MWKLRTHLLTHSSPKKLSKRSDHEYAEPLKNSNSLNSMPPAKKTMSDHPYATKYANPADAVTPAPAAQQQEVVKAIEKDKETAKDSERVNTEHSYGTRQRLASIREGDHAYSTKMPDDPDQILAVQAAQDNLRGSAKRKSSLKLKEDESIPKPRVILGNKYTCDLCGKT